MTNVVDENSGDNALNRARQTNVHPGITWCPGWYLLLM